MNQSEPRRKITSEDQRLQWKKKTNYSLLISRKTDKKDEMQEVKIFGILAYCGNQRLRLVQDITEDVEKLKDLIFLCNAEQLSLYHLDDVIEDFLGER